MKPTYSLLFYLKKERGYKNGPVMIYGRITVEGCPPAEFSTKQKCEPSRWADGAPAGRTEESKSLQNYLDTIARKIRNHHAEIFETCDLVSADMIKKKYLGVNADPTSLVEIFEAHNREMKELVDIGDRAAGTLERYKTSLSHTVEFMKAEYQISDIHIRKIDHQFIIKYEHYLKTKRKCDNNTAINYIKNFAKIINICLDNSWLRKNPFASYRSKLEKVIPRPLTESDVLKLINKVFNTKRLEQVRDVFIFCCFTGLSYADVKKLSREDLFIGIDGKVWINNKRKKTGQESKIPLVPIAGGLIKKYLNDPQCVVSGRVLPVISNQKMNSYLHEITVICELSVDITSHTARHTFATTILLLNGVSLKTASKLLAHATVKQTEHYAQVVDQKVSKDITELEAACSLTHLTPALSLLSQIEQQPVLKAI